jgi:hypothetical protein
MTYNTKRFKRGRNATRKYYGGQMAPVQGPQMDKKTFIKHEGIFTELANKVVNLLKPALKIGLTKALNALEPTAGREVAQAQAQEPDSRLKQAGRTAADILNKGLALILNQVNTVLATPGVQTTVDVEAARATALVTDIFSRVAEKLQDPKLQEQARLAGDELAIYAKILVEAMREPLTELVGILSQAGLKATSAITVGIIKVVTDAMAAVPGVGAVMEVGKIANDVSRAVGDAAEAGSNAATATSKAIFDITENVKQGLKTATAAANQSPAGEVIENPETNVPRGGGHENVKQALAELARAQRAGKKIENRTRLEIARFENPRIQTKNNKIRGTTRRLRRRAI